MFFFLICGILDKSSSFIATNKAEALNKLICSYINSILSFKTLHDIEEKLFLSMNMVSTYHQNHNRKCPQSFTDHYEFMMAVNFENKMLPTDQLAAGDHELIMSCLNGMLFNTKADIDYTCKSSWATLFECWVFPIAIKFNDIFVLLGVGL